MDIRRLTPNEYDEAGRVTALAYAEFRPGPDGDPDDARAWDEYFARLADVRGRDAVAEVWAAVQDGHILGTLTLELEGRVSDHRGPLAANEAHIRMLGVDPDARGRGVARALMEAAIARSLAADKSALTLNTTPMMRAAQHLYAALGFERQPDEVMPDGFRLLAYSLSLSPAPTGTTSPDANSTPSSHSA